MEREEIRVNPSGFPSGASGKEPICQCERHETQVLPLVGRPPGGGHGNPLQSACLENPVERGAWQTAVHGVAQSWAQPWRLSAAHNTAIWSTTESSSFPISMYKRTKSYNVNVCVCVCREPLLSPQRNQDSLEKWLNLGLRGKHKMIQEHLRSWTTGKLSDAEGQKRVEACSKVLPWPNQSNLNTKISSNCNGMWLIKK